MRERRSGDWVVDLEGRHAIESEVERAIRRASCLRLLRSSTTSFDRLDFQLVGPGEHLLELEVKAKHQPLSAAWRALRPDVDPADLFVLDELALRKIVDAGRYAFLLVRDLPRSRWVLWSAGDLHVATRVRHARPLARDASGPSRTKGKLLFDLTEVGIAVDHVDDAIDALATLASRLDAMWADIAPWPQLRRDAV